jgi:hypothetical protein
MQLRARSLRTALLVTALTTAIAAPAAADQAVDKPADQRSQITDPIMQENLLDAPKGADTSEVTDDPARPRYRRHAPRRRYAPRPRVRRHHIRRHYRYRMHSGEPTSYNDAVGEFTWGQNEVVHRGELTQEGDGTSILTIRHYRPGHRHKVKRFVRHHGRHYTHYRMRGRFTRLVISDCHVTSHGRAICKVRTIRR